MSNSQPTLFVTSSGMAEKDSCCVSLAMPANCACDGGIIGSGGVICDGVKGLIDGDSGVVD